LIHSFWRRDKDRNTIDLAPNSFTNGPDEQGRFGKFGGRFVSETLMPLILDLEAEYEKAKVDPAFSAEMDDLWTHYVGRPSPLYFAERLTEQDYCGNRRRSARRGDSDGLCAFRFEMHCVYGCARC